MPFLYKLEKKFGKYAIPGLTKYLIICYVVGYAIQLMGLLNGATSGIMSFLTLDPYAILHGQIWRLMTWLLIPPGAISIFTLITLYFYYMIGSRLEMTWGTFRYNLFMFSGFFFTIIGCFVLYVIFVVIYGGDAVYLKEISAVMGSMFSTYYISMSIFLAFAITYPDMQVLFMFVIPIKIKVLGIIYVVIMLYNVIMSFVGGFIMGLTTSVVIGFSLLNVLIFFIVTRQGFRTPSQIKRQHEYAKKTVRMQAKGVTRHKCAICGRSEESDPDEEFRFCSKCEGNYEYCSRHIYTHVHVKKED
ncbi:MAG TPA: hypothetical protein DCG85_03775 [Lachnospiraceae bacterium]|nr:hypothetical protein [Lachnospiraceae bacterium]